MTTTLAQTTLTARFVEVYEELKKLGRVRSVKQFAETLGFISQNWKGYETGKRRVSPDLAARAAKQYGLSETFLLHGEGPMFVDPASQKTPPAALSRDLIVRMGPDTPQPLGRTIWKVKPLRFVTAKAQAGFADSFLDDITYEEFDIYPYLYITDDPELEDAWVFEVRGESMEPTLRRGSVVITLPVDDGNIQHISAGLYVVIYVIEGYADLVVKRVKTNDLSRGGTLTLYSDNPDGGNLTLNRDHIREVWRVRQAVTDF